MPHYDLRLYKKASPEAAKGILVDQYPLDAADDATAIRMAGNTQIPAFDNSDYYCVFRGKEIIHTRKF
jgi:hypothetical protein